MLVAVEGLSRRQWGILLLAWAGWVFDIMDTALFNFAKTPMLTEMLGPTYKDRGATVEGWIQATFLLGWSIGGLVFGVLADTWGRARTLSLTVLLYCVFTGLTVFCRTPEQVACVRFLTALGVGGEWAAGAALVAEAFPSDRRSWAASMLQSAAAVGPVLAALANLALRGSDWRWLFVLGVAPAFVCFFARGRSVDSAKGVSKPITLQPLRDIWANREWRRRAMVAMAIGAVGIAGAGTATYWQPNLVQEVSQGLSKTDVDARKSFVALVSHVGTLAGVFAAPYFCMRFGRRKTIAAFYVLTPVCVALAIGGGATYTRLLVLLPLVNFFAIGVAAAFVLYFPELFPASVRATGAGMAYNVGRVLSIPVPILTGFAIRHFGGSVAAGVLSTGAIYLLGLIALAFATETKSLSLE